MNDANKQLHTTRTRTILRIKRRRTENPVPCIRLEGLVNSSKSNSNYDRPSTA
eukprot:CAMPEP_0168244258 /NCGR_PEP_ID=MMETSP0140_2-20121125/24514_1 /TAXON_ID=44445 /ORGANISM="Pseudo-nitzschia australis, Strain 10249 10 AB" /LENGTH=52 /DNA_ID=CAMNT_0008179727 /DNA_START=25 /DNA_END=179 /DNA_ORIENTATION=+